MHSNKRLIANQDRSAVLGAVTDCATGEPCAVWRNELACPMLGVTQAYGSGGNPSRQNDP
ncbi:hypothetical protein CBOM_03661 [Ceraceosorus bombacis]|uniref:Uncharacterized protein n=1 Tax=Ceraceosorus bombacis TaxID=401625 RepID=A0A0P1BH18_9BASI|nr:hypothetical protein CBOM_03661 [Ceraceosorus bombacis]